MIEARHYMLLDDHEYNLGVGGGWGGMMNTNTHALLHKEAQHKYQTNTRLLVY